MIIDFALPAFIVNTKNSQRVFLRTKCRHVYCMYAGKVLLMFHTAKKMLLKTLPDIQFKGQFYKVTDTTDKEATKILFEKMFL